LVYDFSGNQNNATCSGTSCPVYNFSNKKLGRSAMEFDGSDDYVEVPYDASNPLYQIDDSDPFTISAWIYPMSDMTYYEGVVGRTYTTSWFFGAGDNDNGVGLYVDNNRCYTALNSVQINTWTHIAGVFNGTDVFIYINGALSKNCTEGTVTMGDASTVRIGENNVGNEFNGTIDELAIWNRSLSADEIYNLYVRGVARLNLSVRSCDDSNCQGESFSGNFENSSGINLNTTITPMNRYFQYRAMFKTEDVNISPILEDVTINYIDVGTNLIRDKNWTNLGDEIYYYNVTVRDKAGNINSTSTRNITLDSTPPLITYAGGTEQTGTYFNRDWIYVNVSVTETNFNNITFYLYNSSFALINETNYTTQVYEINFTNLNPNEYYFYNVTVRDKTGLQSSTETRNITFDSINPVIKLDGPANYTWSGANYQFTATYTPYDVNLDSCSLYHQYNRTDWIANLTNSTLLNNQSNTFTITVNESVDNEFIWNIWCKVLVTLHLIQLTLQ
jgi:hypothetical protein